MFVRTSNIESQRVNTINDTAEQSLPGHIELKGADNQLLFSLNGTNCGTKSRTMPVKYTTPKLSKGKEWFVYFRIWHEEEKRMVLRKFRADLNTLPLRERAVAGRQLLEYITDELKRGWIPEGIPVPNSEDLPVTLIEAMRKVVASKKATLRHRSWQSYRYALTIFERFLKAQGKEWYYVSHFTKNDALDFAEWMQEQSYTGKTFNGYRGFIFTLFQYFVDRDAIVANPMKAVKNLPETAGRHVAYTDAEWERLLNYLDQSKRPRLGLFCRFIYYTYLRPVELLRLKCRNVDLQSGTITIHGNQSKNKKQETVVIPDSFMPYLSELDLSNPDNYLFGKGLNTCATSCSRNSVSGWFRKALNEVGGFTEDHTLYSCKHTGVSNAVRQGINLYDISRQCRHATLTETQNYFRSLGLVPNDGFRIGMK